jgi:hypothetical protein
MEQRIGEAKPDAVIPSAASVGGIAYKNASVDFLFDNLAVELNNIRAALGPAVEQLCPA